MKPEQYRTILISSVPSPQEPTAELGRAPSSRSYRASVSGLAVSLCRAASSWTDLRLQGLELHLASVLRHLVYEGLVIFLSDLRTLGGSFRSPGKDITQRIEDEWRPCADCPNQDACHDYGCGKEGGVVDDEGNGI